jgi:hemerythrin superfamily protein
MDAITMLKEDHKTVEQLFKRFEKAGDKAYVEKRRLVDQIIEELSVHAAVEEQLFYPVTRATVPTVEDVALESLEEHHIVKWVLDELDGMDPEDERFTAKVTVLIENVRHHVEEEEEEYFPKVRDELGRNALADLGEAMEAAKKVAPTHPHPMAPDTPPGNLIMGTAAGMVDRVGDTVGGVVQGGVTALGDVIDLVLKRKTPRPAAKGSPTTRKAANRTRVAASRTTDEVTTAVKRAKKAGKAATKGAKRTVKAAKSGAKGTATSARKGAKRTTTTAKRGATTATKAAKSGAKGTTTSARKAAKRTTTTAKRGATTTARTARKAARSTSSAARRS